MLNKRQQQIIHILEKSGSWITGNELAAMVEISGRTVRSDILAVNNFYSGSRIESDKRRGYRFNRELVYQQCPQMDRQIPKGSKERCSYILQALLFHKKELNFFFLQEQLYTSDYSIENDIRKVKKILEEWPDLVLIRKANHLRLAGSERSKRQLYRRMLTEETEGNFLNLNNLASLYTNFDLLEVKKILDAVFVRHDYHVREITVPMLMLHIGVSIERILEENYVKSEKQYEGLENRLEYKIAKEFFERVGLKFHIPIIMDEIVLLSLYLSERSGNMLEEDQDFEWLVEDIMENIYQTFDIDFREDPELKHGLGIHLQYMLERISQNGCISNICIQEIKGKYPLVYEMGCYVARLIEDFSRSPVSESEIGFIALHLGCAYERLNLNEKYRIVIICPYNRGLLSHCMDKMNTLFKDRMEIIESLTLFEKSAVQGLRPDLLVTTFPLKHNLTIPTVQISLLMNQEDESTVFQALSLLDQERFQKSCLPRIISMIRPEFFYTDLEFNTPKEIIEFVCDQLFEAGYLPDSFKESVLSRELLSETSFSYRFAIPHSLNVPSIRSVFPVVLLKRPVSWGKYEVKMVILLAIAEEDRDMMRIFFDWLGNMAGDAKKLSHLVESTDQKSFIRILKGIE